MARRAAKRASPDSEDEHETRRGAAKKRLTPSCTTQAPSESPSPAISFSSDKENRAADAVARARSKSSTTVMPSRSGTASSGRRPGLEDRSDQPLTPTPAHRENEMEDEGQREGEGHNHSILDTRYYDPEQTLGERRPLRKAFRDLTRELQESHNEYMSAHSTGIYDTVLAANEQFSQIKQTSDATLDSNLLVKAADLAARRSVLLAHGGAARGLDAGEFAARCAAFMRRGPAADFLGEASADVRAAVDRGSGRTRIRDDEEDDVVGTQADDGDELNWAWLGLRCAQPSNMRPPTPGFLLGPLSVVKKARAATQRTQRQGRQDVADAVRPAELGAEQIEKQENANLTLLCRKIYKLLRRTQRRALDAVEAEAAARGDNLTPQELSQLLETHHLRDDRGVDLLHFAFNPQSFGQTVENLFYISFLVRDGKAGLAADNLGRPSLHPTDPSDPAAAAGQAGSEASNQTSARNRASSSKKKQAVFHLDFDMWTEICKAFDIRVPIIPHRDMENPVEVGAEAWYG